MTLKSQPIQPRTMPQDVGARVRCYRKAAGMSVGELAGCLRVCPAYIEQVERGDLRPSAPMAAMLAEVLRVPVDEFRDGG